MFAMADMDCDGMLTRDEFSWFTLRTEGAEVDDEKWQVVEGEDRSHSLKNMYNATNASV